MQRLLKSKSLSENLDRRGQVWSNHTRPQGVMSADTRLLRFVSKTMTSCIISQSLASNCLALITRLPRVLLCLAVLVMAGTGCVSRTYTVKSPDPFKKYDLFLDGEYIGKTPYTSEFTFYGTHELITRDETGRQRIGTVVFKRPWYQYFPIDLFPEVFYPGTITDAIEFIIDPPKEIEINFEIIKRNAEEFRKEYREQLKQHE